jgi:16S rRNA (guanine527-N7)-methyltransferase
VSAPATGLANAAANTVANTAAYPQTVSPASDLGEHEAHRARLQQYVALVAKWNKVYNLTAIRDEPQMWTLHVLDSLSLSPFLPAGRVLDVGSGAGLPSLPLAVVRPDLAFTSVDSVEKKIAFQRQAAAELGLDNHHAVHARVESLAEPPYPAITSRAFASLADFVAGTRHLLAPGGCWYAMKGDAALDEVAALPKEIQAKTHTLSVPGLDAKRHLIKLWVVPADWRG